MRGARGWCSAVECGWWWWRGVGGRERGEEDETRATAREGERTEEAARDGWGRGTPRFSLDCCPPSPPLFCPRGFVYRGTYPNGVFSDGYAPAASGDMSRYCFRICQPVCAMVLVNFLVPSWAVSDFRRRIMVRKRGERDGNCRFRLLFVNISCFDVGSICRS
jgi:hypothetical protein